MNKLQKDFYVRNVLIVAKELLGKIFVYHDKITGVKLSGRIVEVEAYDGSLDEAAHSFRGKTERNNIMFEEGGYLYVYFTYGIHYCANVVTGNKNQGTAILIRALEPISGVTTFSERRFGKKEINEKEKINLLNGPAKICQAFGIYREHNTVSLLGDNIYILNSEKLSDKKIIKTTRIGIKKSVELPWRFYIKDCPFVSKVHKNG